MFHTLVYLKNVLYPPGLKFKVEFVDEFDLAKGKRTMTLQAVLMNMEVSETKEELTFGKGFAQVGPVHWGPNTGSTAVVFWND